MPDYTVKRIDDMEALFRGAMRKVRAELGVTSFGVQSIDLPPLFDQTPWHDHASDGQEELYIALRGAGWLEIEGGQKIELVPGETAVRVGPATRRRLLAGAPGIRVLAIGGTPDSAYATKDFTELGAPDPAAR